MRRLALPLVGALLGACGDPAPGPMETSEGVEEASVEDAATADTAGETFDAAEPPLRCNGAEVLCARRYDEVSYATTHNAMSNETEGWFAPNQTFGLARQLEDGVRGLMLDVHEGEGEDEGEVVLCHGLCLMGREPLTDGLGKVRAFLDAHPHEVVTLIFESYVSADAIEGAMTASGLLAYAHAQPEGEPWPTLGEMVASDRRLVVFTDHEGGARPWYLDVWAFAFETHYAFETPEDLDCAANRGDPSSSLFILNHFLTNPLPHPDWAELINHDPLFIERALACEAEHQRLPSFVTVDFYDIGDVFAVVDALNFR